MKKIIIFCFKFFLPLKSHFVGKNSNFFFSFFKDYSIQRMKNFTISYFFYGKLSKLYEMFHYFSLGIQPTLKLYFYAVNSYAFAFSKHLKLAYSVQFFNVPCHSSLNGYYRVENYHPFLNMHYMVPVRGYYLVRFWACNLHYFSDSQILSY